MALRMLEVTAPSESLGRVSALLEDAPVVHFWTTADGDAIGFTRILLDSQDAESVSDLLVNALGSQPGFRLALVPVEATVPPILKPEKAEAQDGPREKPVKVGPKRISREELYEDLAEASRLTMVFAVMVSLSTVVAAVGLIRGDVAIVIGAMVIAPLLGPNMALSLASTLGDPELARRSLKTIGVGVSIAALLSLIVGALLTVDPSAPEIAARTQPGISDIALALAAGAAGSLAFTSGVPAVVVGVMVAVALLPPLVVAGLLAGSGHPMLAIGALVLSLTNMTCINLAAVATFLIQKVRPRTWWEADRAKRATRVAAFSWMVMLLVLVAVMLFGDVGAS